MTWEKPIIKHGKLTKWNWLVLYPDNLKLGNNTDIGAFCLLDAKNQIIIEDDVKIGSHCSIYTHSTIDNKQGQVIIKKNARIGSHSTIMPDCIIGENSIIAAHSFVNSDVQSNSMVGGVPIHIIKKRIINQGNEQYISHNGMTQN